LKILTVSDRVSQELLDPNWSNPVMNGIDLIFSCGDLPPEFLTSLRNKYHAPLMFILGNHDIRYKESPPVGCQNIDRKLVKFKGKQILGLSGSRWYNGGQNQYSEIEMKQRISKMRFHLWRKGGPDIVVSHAPPRHIRDAEDPCHKGFRSFNALIDKYSPSHFIHGHIHSFFENDNDRITRVNSTQVINSYGFYVFEI